MSYRYKQALLSLVSMALIYAWYFARLVIDRQIGAHGDQPVRLAGTVAAIAIVQILGNVVIAGTSSDRYGAMDERERGFDRRATSAGYYLLIVGSLAAAATLHFGARAHDMANAMLLAIVIAECTRQGLFLALHHRAA